jgi:hypothetical protein
MTKKTLEARTIRILVLSVAFFLSGLVFFGWRMVMEGKESTREPVFSPDTFPSIEGPARPIPSLAKYPAPSVFHQFTYERGKPLTVKGECADAYYAVMVFHEDIDYRVSPLDARYNTAFPCENGSFSTSIPIETLFLTEGEGYYVIKAEQGTKGTWYAPY